MSPESKTVKSYLEELRSARSDKPPQIREALEVYIDLWKRVVEKGVVRVDDSVDSALKKIDENGGLYQAAQ